MSLSSKDYRLTGSANPVTVAQAMATGDQARPSGRLTQTEFDRDKLMIRIEVTLNADPTAISPVVEGIMEMARRMDCASGKEFEIETAVREALANAILHGCKNDPTQKIQCIVTCNESAELLIVVRDPGSGFEPLRVPDPLSAENLHSHHGRGIYLISQFMDEVRFEEGGRAIHMRARPGSALDRGGRPGGTDWSDLAS